ncbi:hypothetical protein KSP40_PGU008477 [Platanthera guangdongensis]|uniref:Bet v I/Major latex protein domain-containing protein n=1 Tax=Platanthera guangdongensis TaxID=2320717 RepID=A0ABR2MYJ8_9ASPA
MASRQQVEVEADGVDIETLWRALTTDRVEVIQKANPGFFTDSKILEGDGFALGSLLCISFGAGEALLYFYSVFFLYIYNISYIFIYYLLSKAASNLEPLKERIVEFDERKHVVAVLGVEGGHLNLGFTHYVESFKLDDAGGGKTMVNACITYDLRENFDGTQLLDEFLKLQRHYLDSIIAYLQQKHED